MAHLQVLLGAFTGSGEAALFNEKIDTNTQGLRAEDYSDVFSLLTNNDEYQYNVISAPGLIHGVSAHTGVLNTLISNTQNRGDAIAVVDLSKYGSTITAALLIKHLPLIQATQLHTGLGVKLLILIQENKIGYQLQH